jgi:hypothetical protein
MSLCEFGFVRPDVEVGVFVQVVIVCERDDYDDDDYDDDDDDDDDADDNDDDDVLSSLFSIFLQFSTAKAAAES